MLEAEALHTAAAMLPPATEVNAIADCTVAGKAHRYKKPMYTVNDIHEGTKKCSAKPNKGNNTNVLANTNKCKRQCPMPCLIASRDNLAPCMKNSKAIAAVVKYSKPTFTSPCTGNTLASTITPINITKKRSIFSFCNQ